MKKRKEGEGKSGAPRPTHRRGGRPTADEACRAPPRFHERSGTSVEGAEARERGPAGSASSVPRFFPSLATATGDVTVGVRRGERSGGRVRDPEPAGRGGSGGGRGGGRAGRAVARPVGPNDLVIDSAIGHTTKPGSESRVPTSNSRVDEFLVLAALAFIFFLYMIPIYAHLLYFYRSISQQLSFCQYVCRLVNSRLARLRS